MLSNFKRVFAKNRFAEWMFKQEASCFEETFFYSLSALPEFSVQLDFTLPIFNLKGKC